MRRPLCPSIALACLMLASSAHGLALRRDPFQHELLSPQKLALKTVSHISSVPHDSPSHDPIRVITVPLTGVTNAGEADKEALGQCSIAIYRYEDSYKMHYVIRTFNLTGQLPPESEHIHEGKDGQKGDVRFSLKGKWAEQENPTSVQWNLAGAVSFSMSDKNATEAMKRLLAQPSTFYISVHTPGFPDGAIRGQL